MERIDPRCVTIYGIWLQGANSANCDAVGMSAGGVERQIAENDRRLTRRAALSAGSGSIL